MHERNDVSLICAPYVLKMRGYIFHSGFFNAVQIVVMSTYKSVCPNSAMRASYVLILHACLQIELPEVPPHVGYFDISLGVGSMH